MLEAGEREVRRIFEDVTTGNVKAVLGHANETRTMLRDVEKKVKSLENMVLTQQGLLDILRSQLANLQAKMYIGGSS